MWFSRDANAVGFLDQRQLTLSARSLPQRGFRYSTALQDNSEKQPERGYMGPARRCRLFLSPDEVEVVLLDLPQLPKDKARLAIGSMLEQKTRRSRDELVWDCACLTPGRQSQTMSYSVCYGNRARVFERCQGVTATSGWQVAEVSTFLHVALKATERETAPVGHRVGYVLCGPSTCTIALGVGSHLLCKRTIPRHQYEHPELWRTFHAFAAQHPLATMPRSVYGWDSEQVLDLWGDREEPILVQPFAVRRGVPGDGPFPWAVKP